MKTYKVKWKCSYCGNKHRWEWPDYDLLDVGDKIEMECNCGRKTPCYLARKKDGVAKYKKVKG